MAEPKRTKVFIGSSKEDGDSLALLKTHLRQLELANVLDYWDETRTAPGDAWLPALQCALDEATVAILIISGHFLASELANAVTFPTLLTRAQTGGVRILSVIVRPCLWESSPLTAFKPVNSVDSARQSLTDSQREEALVATARAVISNIDQGVSGGEHSSSQIANSPIASHEPPNSNLLHRTEKRAFRIGLLVGAALMNLLRDAWHWVRDTFGISKTASGAKITTVTMSGIGVTGTTGLAIYLLWPHAPVDPSPRTFLADLALPSDLSVTKLVESNLVAHPPYIYRPEMKPIEPGVFKMGDIHYEDEKWPHRVQITHRFMLSETEVTQEQYLAVMRENPSRFSDQTNWKILPVENVSWFEAIEYCNKLSSLEGRELCYLVKESAAHSAKKVLWQKFLNCRGYRLPTEAEWEFAARGGAIQNYAGSDIADKVGWFSDNSEKRTHLVKDGKASNTFGIFDMSGNVWEWVWDGYSRNGYPSYSAGAQRDPISPVQGPLRAIRGGSWHEAAKNVHVTRHDARKPNEKASTIGFRIAKSY